MYFELNVAFDWSLVWPAHSWGEERSVLSFCDNNAAASIVVVTQQAQLQ